LIFLMRTFALLFFISAAFCILTPEQQFKDFILSHKRQYASAEERSMRFEIFKDNLKEIKRLNDLHDGATYGITRFADMTVEEFFRKFTTRPRAARKFGVIESAVPNLESYPESFDWRDYGVVTPVKDQGPCGSCWAFSSAQNAEGVWAVAGNELSKFAPQQLVDCVTADDYGCDGCNGGFAIQASKYIVDVGGIELEEDYPYTATEGTCKFNKNRIAASFAGTTDIHETDDSLAEFIYTHGPASVGVRADSRWQLYTGGILDNRNCYLFNHDVLAVGWGVENGQKYWIIKNSWGVSWGEEGYIRVVRGDDCIAKDAHTIVIYI